MEESVGWLPHYTPAAQEWYNSVYTYNKNYVKTLPTADVNLIKLLKSYFNQKVKSGFLKDKRKKINNKKSIFLYSNNNGNKKSILLSIKKRLNKYFGLSLENNKNNLLKLLFLKNKNKLKKFKALSIKKSEENGKYTLYFRKFRKKKPKLYRRKKKSRIRKVESVKKRQKIRKSNFLSTKRVFVGKGNLKHTNDKVVITFFLFDAKNMFISAKYRKEKKKLFYPSRAFRFRYYKDSLNKRKFVVRYRREHSLYEFLASRLIIASYKEYLNERTKIYKKYLKKINKVLEVNNYFILNNKERLDLLNLLIKGVDNLKYPKYKYYYNVAYWLHTRKFMLYLKLMTFNKKKHKYSFLFKFIPLIENLYRKKVVFNIVNLKKLHLSSDIYTQMLSMKLRNRNNKPYKILNRFMSTFKIKDRLRPIKIFDPSEYYDFFKINHIKNNPISLMYNKIYRPLKFDKLQTENKINKLMINFEDPLNNILLQYFDTTNNNHEWKRTDGRYKKWAKKYKHKKNIIENGIPKTIYLPKEKKNVKILRNPWKANDIITFNYILNSLKHNKLNGIRVEAKGRLTRRRTASRSVYIMKYKGGLRNERSSFVGIPAILLRGDKKSNVEYSFVSSNGRNGAFGLKGWIATV